MFNNETNLNQRQSALGEYAGIPREMQNAPDTAIIQPDNADRKKSRFVVNVGDSITPFEKYADSTRAFGGVVLEKYLTLRHTGGMLYRCQITELKQFMKDENPMMLAPDDRKTASTGYVVKNGQFNGATGMWEDKTVSGSVYLPFYPGDEIVDMTRAKQSLETGGTVEVTALAGKTAKERDAFQQFYFPNWNRLQAGLDQFPRTLRELRARIEERLKIAVAEVDADLVSVGRDLLKSCTEYRNWALRYIKVQTQIVQAAKLQAGALVTGYNDMAEMLMEILEFKREDAILSELNNIAAANYGQVQRIEAQAPSAEADARIAAILENQNRLIEALFNKLEGNETPAPTQASAPSPADEQAIREFEEFQAWRASRSADASNEVEKPAPAPANSRGRGNRPAEKPEMSEVK
ncbi:MAG TPA: hypothetical protein VGB68_15170 [Pyrinomonadaceae bacterium]